MSEERLLGRAPWRPTLEKVADDVWLLRGDVRHGMNVYFLAEDDGVVQFDAGTRGMVKANRAAAERLGPIKRIVLGHAHADHRGTASAMGVPVLCHPDEIADAESDAAIPAYMDLSLLEVAPIRRIYPTLLKRWDGGPVQIDGIVSEGDEVAGFKVFDFPGHAPGLIGLWRESDRLAIVSDTVYFVDSARLRPLPPGEATVPHPAFAWNHQRAKDSLRKLAALDPATVCAGHAEPVRDASLRAMLEAAAEKY
jgi:glyoxylase-like metal-dependent hydrolase (beta-lactamase superfamily II)